jgi:hypothetical protein
MVVDDRELDKWLYVELPYSGVVFGPPWPIVEDDSRGVYTCLLCNQQEQLGSYNNMMNHCDSDQIHELRVHTLI